MGLAAMCARLLPMKPRILVVSTTPPLPISTGGNQRTNLLLRALSKRASEIALVTLTSHDRVEPVAGELCKQFGWICNAAPIPAGKNFPWGLARPLAPSLVDRVAHNIGGLTSHALRRQKAAAEGVAAAVRMFSPDLIVARYLSSAVMSDAFAWAPVLVDLDDHPLSVYETRLSDPRLTGYRAAMVRRHLWQLRRVVPAFVSRAAGLFIASAEDSRFLGSQREMATVLPNIVYFDGQEHPTPIAMEDSEPATILVVGSWSHRPNIDGLDWFLKNAWPIVKAARPDARLRVVGSRLSDADRRRWGVAPGVEVVGFADRLEDEYRRARLTICTQFEGGGTKIKVLESLAFGRPVVVTPHSHRGYQLILPDGQCLLVADSGLQTAEACIRLIDDSDLAFSLAAKGTEVVRKFYSFSRFVDSVAEGVDRALQFRKALQ